MAVIENAVLDVHLIDQLGLDVLPAVLDGHQSFSVDWYPAALHTSHSSRIATSQQRLAESLGVAMMDGSMATSSGGSGSTSDWQ